MDSLHFSSWIPRQWSKTRSQCHDRSCIAWTWHSSVRFFDCEIGKISYNYHPILELHREWGAVGHLFPPQYQEGIATVQRLRLWHCERASGAGKVWDNYHNTKVRHVGRVCLNSNIKRQSYWLALDSSSWRLLCVAVVWISSKLSAKLY